MCECRLGQFRTEFSTLLLLTRDIEADTESLKQVLLETSSRCFVISGSQFINQSQIGQVFEMDSPNPPVRIFVT